MVNFNVEDTRERDLEKYFERFGRLTRVQIKRTYAFVQYEEVSQAEAAMKETHLSRFMGMPCVLSFLSRSWCPFIYRCCVRLYVWDEEAGSSWKRLLALIAVCKSAVLTLVAILLVLEDRASTVTADKPALLASHHSNLCQAGKA